MAPVHVLLVVDGFFTLGPQDRNDNSFSVSHLITVLQATRTADISIFLDTAHRDGDQDATYKGRFDFATSVSDLSMYDEIWMLGYNGWNGMDPLNKDVKRYLGEDELFALANFMQGGGGVLASGDHEGLGSYMCGLVPRVRTMRKWFARGDDDEHVPKGAPPNWPVKGPERADTLQVAHDSTYLYENQSDNIPQPLNIKLVPNVDIHEILKIGEQKVLEHFPDHFHEGEVLGFGGVDSKESEPWTLTDTLTFKGKSFTDYPSKDGHQEVPQVIATGNVIGGHETINQSGKLCASGFQPDNTATNAKTINTLSVYDGWRVGVGRVVTDSSFHHFTDLNLIGDPCALKVRAKGLDEGMLDDIPAFYVNVVKWLARRR